MDATGETPELSIDLAGIFAGEIDFNSDLQPGDSFSLMVEKIYREGRFAGYGPILAATFVNHGKHHQAVRFTPPGGQTGYYDEEGRSLKRFFLKSPLKFEPRVTSGFSYNRMHPILQQQMAHLGVDYAAPIGAPVIAVSNGVVVSAGEAGGAGRMVHLRHASGYETMYLHLSAFARGVRAGAHVEQGQVVGYVGASGLATGPHLDYRIRRNGVFVNPLREHQRMPPGDPIPASLLAQFRADREHLLGQLNAATRVPLLAAGMR